jgi:hypothetical protein
MKGPFVNITYFDLLAHPPPLVAHEINLFMQLPVYHCAAFSASPIQLSNSALFWAIHSLT